MNREPLNTSKPERRILSEDDLGDLADNSSALLFVEELIAACRIKDALESLRILRDHIKASTDIKSHFYLLRRVETKILLLEG